MSKEELKKVTVQVSEDTLISIKILALKKRVPLGEYVKEVLDKHVQNKSKQLEEK